MNDYTIINVLKLLGKNLEYEKCIKKKKIKKNDIEIC